MSLPPLTDAECGQINSLSKLTTHITHDHTHADTHGFASTSDQLVEQFLQETRAIPQSFRMDDLMREMHEIESQRSNLPPILASAVKDQIHDDAWAQQYIQDGKMFHEHNYEDIWNQMSAQGQENVNFNVFENAWLENAQSEPIDLQESAGEEIHGDDPHVYSKFMKFMKSTEEENEIVLDDGKLTQQEAQAWADDFLQQKESTSLDQTWATDYENTQDEAEQAAFWDKLQEELGRVSGTTDNSSLYFNTPQRDYEFSEENPMLDLSNPMERGKQLLLEGDLPSAVLCFEAAVKQQPENAEAWLLLGTTQAENEQDPNAIAALNRCLQLDPNNLSCIMAAAVSYTNESYYNQACFMLISWLKNNPKYKDLVPESLNLTRASQKLVQDLYIKAAQRNPQNLDYELQCGLGVLCNLTGEYDKAADCFRAALSVKPEDARLWNRLGATLANGSKSEEAVEAYHHALNLVPGFIRARYNVGITCINLRAYKEAAEHFLTALNQQAKGRDVLNSGSVSQMSETIWSTLQMCISLMDRTDLRPLVKDKNLQELNKVFNID